MALIDLLIPEMTKEHASLQQQANIASGKRGSDVKPVRGTDSNLKLYAGQFFHAERIQMLADMVSGREVGQFQPSRHMLMEHIDELTHYQERHPDFVLSMMPACNDLMKEGTPLKTELSAKVEELQQAEGVGQKPGWLKRILGGGRNKDHGGGRAGGD